MIANQKELRQNLESLSRPDLYIKTLKNTFRIHDNLGRQFNYEPTQFQIAWHKDFFMADPDRLQSEEAQGGWLHRLYWKGRGIGATATTMMDLIMAAITYEGLTIPVSSITGRQAKKGPIAWGLWLCDNTQKQGLIKRDTNINSEIRITTTDSVIFEIPGSSPNSFRTFRSPMIFFDEYDWCEQQKTLLDAGWECMSEGGQATFVSTIQNTTGEFMRLIRNAKELGVLVHKVPVLQPEDKFDPSKPIQEQIDSGRIDIIAPWLNIPHLERGRKKDLVVFLRENMCEAPDASVNFISWKLIQRSCNLREYKHSNRRTWIKLRRKPHNINPFIMGVDFSRYRDLSVIEIVEHTPIGLLQVYEEVMRGSDTPYQNSRIDALQDTFHCELIRIDMTGAGQGLYDYAYQKHGSRVLGVHFASSTESDYDPDMKIKTKDLYALNLRRRMQDNKVMLFDQPELKEDLHSIPYDLSDPRRSEEGSHGDRFWALALACYRYVDYASWVSIV